MPKTFFVSGENLDKLWANLHNVEFALGFALGVANREYSPLVSVNMERACAAIAELKEWIQEQTDHV